MKDKKKVKEGKEETTWDSFNPNRVFVVGGWNSMDDPNSVLAADWGIKTYGQPFGQGVFQPARFQAAEVSAAICVFVSAERCRRNWIYSWAGNRRDTVGDRQAVFKLPVNTGHQPVLELVSCRRRFRGR